MTVPFRRSSASYVSSVNETFRGLMPPTVAEDDLLVVHYAGDGTLTSLRDITGGFLGFNRLFSFAFGTMVSGILTKIANGDESGLTLVSGASPSEKWCVSASAFGSVDLYSSTPNNVLLGTAANPNPDSLPITSASWPHSDAAYLSSLAGDAAGVISGGPSGFNVFHTLNNGAADGCALSLAELYQFSVANLDPTAWTRASAAYHTATLALRCRQFANHPTLKRRQGSVFSGTTRNFSVTIPAGLRRRFFAFLQNATQADIVSVTLDPAGLNLPLSVATNGVTAAVSAAASTAGAGSWWTLHPCPPAGTYTLRVVTGGSQSCCLLSTTAINAAQQLLVHDVSNGLGTSSTHATGTIVVPRRGLVLLAAVQPQTAQFGDGTWNTRLVGVESMLAQVSAWSSSTPQFCTMFAEGFNDGGSLAIDIEGVRGGSPVEAYSAISLGHEPGHNCCIHGGS